jgi:nucleotide-binding universal stress UspA family protein
MTMYKHILIPTDGSETAEKAVEAGIEFARESKARVTWFTAVPEYQLPSQAAIMAHQEVVTPDEHARRSRQIADSLFARLSERAKKAGVECDTDFTHSDHPYEAIIEAAKRNGCDLIFMASHGRTGLSALVHGSETTGVLTHSSIPTLVYR